MNAYYYNDPYCRILKCSVVGINHKQNCTEVLLDRTIFYPECGGQPGDRGSFGPFKILDTQKAENGDSLHILEKDCSIKIGDSYNLILDWDHRYKYMIMHTCQHLLSGLLFSEFGIGTVAVHLGEDYLTIETEKSEIAVETLDNLVKFANLRISENHKILYHEMSHSEAEKLGLRRSIKVDGDVRIVEIQDVDRIACGGVHVSSTSEISLVCYYAQEQIRGHVRLFFRCGQDAVEHLISDSKTLSEISTKLTCSPKEASGKLESVLNEFSEIKNKYKAAQRTLAKIELEKNISNQVAVFDTQTELSFFSEQLEDYQDLCLCIVNDNKWLIVLKGKFEDVDFNLLRKDILPIINAKGGGRNPVYQGIGQDMSKINEFKKAFLELVSR